MLTSPILSGLTLLGVVSLGAALATDKATSASSADPNRLRGQERGPLDLSEHLFLGPEDYAPHKDKSVVTKYIMGNTDEDNCVGAGTETPRERLDDVLLRQMKWGTRKTRASNCEKSNDKHRISECRKQIKKRPSKPKCGKHEHISGQQDWFVKKFDRLKDRVTANKKHVTNKPEAAKPRAGKRGIDRSMGKSTKDKAFAEYLDDVFNLEPEALFAKPTFPAVAFEPKTFYTSFSTQLAHSGLDGWKHHVQSVYRGQYVTWAADGSYDTATATPTDVATAKATETEEDDVEDEDEDEDEDEEEDEVDDEAVEDEDVESHDDEDDDDDEEFDKKDEEDYTNTSTSASTRSRQRIGVMHATSTTAEVVEQTEVSEQVGDVENDEETIYVDEGFEVVEDLESMTFVPSTANAVSSTSVSSTITQTSTSTKTLTSTGTSTSTQASTTLASTHQRFGKIFKKPKIASESIVTDAVLLTAASSTSEEAAPTTASPASETLRIAPKELTLSRAAITASTSVEALDDADDIETTTSASSAEQTSSLAEKGNADADATQTTPTASEAVTAPSSAPSSSLSITVVTAPSSTSISTSTSSSSSAVDTGVAQSIATADVINGGTFPEIFSSELEAITATLPAAGTASAAPETAAVSADATSSAIPEAAVTTAESSDIPAANGATPTAPVVPLVLAFRPFGKANKTKLPFSASAARKLIYAAGGKNATGF